MDDATLLNFGAELDACFERAAAGRRIVRRFGVGSRSIELQFAGDAALQCFGPAIATWDAAGSGAAPDLTVCVWDSRSTAVVPPRPPWSPERLGPLGDVSALPGARWRAAFNVDSQCLSWADTRAGRCHFWARSAAELPGYERAAPLRTLLSWGALDWGFVFAHAGCVANSRHGTLLVGKGGSGKSTCALSCLGSELRYVADDYCMLSGAGAEPTAHGVYATGKLEARHLSARLPELALGAQRRAGEAKDIVYIEGEARRRLAEPVRLAALVMPQVRGVGATTLTRASPAEALASLGPSSVFQVPGLGASALQRLANVVRRLPCHTLAIGADLSRVRQVLAELLGDAEVVQCRA